MVPRQTLFDIIQNLINYTLDRSQNGMTHLLLSGISTFDLKTNLFTDYIEKFLYIEIIN